MRTRKSTAAGCWLLFISAAQGQPPPQADDPPASYLEFVQDFTSTCVSRQGVQILVRSRHPSRTLRVWLDRFHMGVGTGDRSERIRTYNYPQGRVTDHRINLTLYQLPAIMEGALADVIGPLQQEWQAEQLASLE